MLEAERHHVMLWKTCLSEAPVPVSSVFMSQGRFSHGDTLTGSQQASVLGCEIHEEEP